MNSLECTLLKQCQYPSKKIKELIEYSWETNPGMNLDWIIENIDGLYIILLEDDVIGFFQIQDTCNIRQLNYFEIMKQHQRKGYGSYIASGAELAEVDSIYCYQDKVKLWVKLMELEEDWYIYDCIKNKITFI